MANSPDLTQRVVTWPPIQRVLARPDVRRVLGWARIDFDPDHRPPAWWRVALATVLSIALALAADAALVAIGTRVFPATQGYVHFAFADYAKLTVVGIVIACAGWPIVARVCAAPRWLSSASPSRSPSCCSCPTCGSGSRGNPPRAWPCSWRCTWPSR